LGNYWDVVIDSGVHDHLADWYVGWGKNSLFQSFFIHHAKTEVTEAFHFLKKLVCHYIYEKINLVI